MARNEAAAEAWERRRRWQVVFQDALGRAFDVQMALDDAGFSTRLEFPSASTAAVWVTESDLPDARHVVDARVRAGRSRPR